MTPSQGDAATSFDSDERRASSLDAPRRPEGSPRPPAGRGTLGSLARGLLGLVALAAAVHAFTFLGAGPFDDDFIVHRYARNWIDGHGLVFEPGVKVEGYTVPLWVMLSALAQLAGFDPARAGQWIAVVASAAAALALGALWLRRFPRAIWPVPALVLAAAPTFAWHAASGLGTTLMGALLAGWLWAWQRARLEGGERGLVFADLCLALACLLRQEFALFVLPYWLFESSRGRARAALWPLVSLGGWTLFRLVYYGHLLPTTYAVKKLPLAIDVGYGLRDLAWAMATCGAPLMLVAAIVGLKRARRRGEALTDSGSVDSGSGEIGTQSSSNDASDANSANDATGGTDAQATADFASERAPDSTLARDLDAALLVGLALHALYIVYVGGDFMPWSRFWMPTLPLVIFVACARLRVELRALPALAAVATLAALILPQWLQSGRTIHGRPQRFGEHAFFEERWAALGRHFRAHFPPDTRVAIAPIGAFGFESRLPLFDILGLTEPGFATLEPDLSITMKGHHRSDAERLIATRPAAVILGNGVLQPDGRLVVNPWERAILLHTNFASLYRRLWMPIDESGPLVYFLRRDLPLPAGAREL